MVWSDNATPADPSDDFDDEFLEIVVGTVPPNVISVGGADYTSLGTVFDHLDSSFDFSGDQALAADLTSVTGASSAWVCFHYSGTYSWFAQVDNAGVRSGADDCAAVFDDTDGDGVIDAIDNCTGWSRVQNITRPLDRGESFASSDPVMAHKKGGPLSKVSSQNTIPRFWHSSAR